MILKTGRPLPSSLFSYAAKWRVCQWDALHQPRPDARISHFSQQSWSPGWTRYLPNRCERVQIHELVRGPPATSSATILYCPPFSEHLLPPTSPSWGCRCDRSSFISLPAYPLSLSRPGAPTVPLTVTIPTVDEPVALPRCRTIS